MSCIFGLLRYCNELYFWFFLIHKWESCKNKLINDGDLHGVVFSAIFLEITMLESGGKN